MNLKLSFLIQNAYIIAGVADTKKREDGANGGVTTGKRKREDAGMESGVRTLVWRAA